MPWSLDDLIEASDIDYEASIARDPNDIETWRLYVAHRLTQSLKHKLFVLERAVTQFPASEEFWTYYLELVTEECLPLSYPRDKNSIFVVARLYSRALVLHYNNHNIWIQYLQFIRSKLPSLITFTRRAFNRSLAYLDVSKHKLVWPLYLEFAKLVEGPTGSLIIKKYLQYADPEYLSLEHPAGSMPNISDAIDLLVSFGDFSTAMNLQRAILTSLNLYTGLAKPPLDFGMEYVKLVSEYANDDALFENAVALVLDRFPDQCAPVYLVVLHHYEQNQQKVRHFMHKALRSCTTVSDFVTIFDAFARYEEQHLETIAIQAEDASTDMAHSHLDCAMIQFEALIDSRPILLNDMLLRQDVHNLDAWFSRLKLFETDTEKLLQTYVAALSSVNPFKAHSLSGNSHNQLSQLWIDYAAVYSNLNDFKTANTIFQKSTELQFAHPDDLARIYCAWSETLLASGDEAQAVEVLRRVLYVADTRQNIRYTDKTLPVSQRISKSAKLWSFYVDLVESLVDVEGSGKCAPQDIERVSAAYDELIKSKVATGQNIINYANFLHENSFFEESFRVYDRGLDLFTDPEILLQLWKAYLPAAVKRMTDSSERVRDLFDQCLFGSRHLPPIHAQDMVKMYHEYEDSQNSIGFARNVLVKEISLIRQELSHPHILDVESLANIKQDLYLKLCRYTAEKCSDDSLARATFEEALEDNQLTKLQVVALSLEYIEFEASKSQFQRARALFAYAGELGNPELASMSPLWSLWEQFELKHGNEASYKQVLRAKRKAYTEHASAEATKLAVNPLGFVKETAKPNDSPQPDTDPAQLEIDMDM